MSTHVASNSAACGRAPSRWQGNRCRVAGIMVAVAMVVFGCATSPGTQATPSADERATEHGRRFDRVEHLVRTRYYDRELRGVDWQALYARYRPRAVAAANDDAWYRTVNGFLLALRDAHTRAERPRSVSSAVVRLVPGPAAPPRGGGLVHVLEDGTVALRFDHFDPSTVRWLTRQIARHRDAPGMIIDLRSNRGGSVTANQRAVGLFFSRPVTMGHVTHRNGRRVVERSRRSGPVGYSGPVALLVGPDSHSSAEVFARVLQYYERAIVIGMPTAGEVLGARSYRLPDGGRLYISTSDFTCCDGERLEGVGVTPDVTMIGLSPEFELAVDPAVAIARNALEASREPAR